MNVLVADDDPVCRSILVGLLQEWHFQAHAVENGAEALAALGGPAPPSLIILDWMMPEMDGFETCRRIRESVGERLPYVLLMTSNSSREEITKVLVAGADDFLIKPFEPLDLKVRIRTAMRIVTLEGSRDPFYAA